MAQRFALTVAGELSNLEKIAEFVTGAAIALGLDEQRAFEIQMAVDEACTNIIQYAYEPGAPGTIEIACEIEADDLLVTIRDWGRPFDPSQAPEPDTTCSLDERQVGGLGIHFMRKLTDRLDLQCGPQGNKLRLYKRRPR